MISLQHAGLTDQGRVREKNEDNWVAFPEEGIFIVADGMGGQFAGEVASQLVVDRLPGLLRTAYPVQGGLSVPKIKNNLLKALTEMSLTMSAQARSKPELTGMGSTAVCAVFQDGYAYVGYLGDSRAYRFREGKLKRLTHDHSIAQLLIDAGELTEAEAMTHPGRSRLTRHVGMEGQPLPQMRDLRASPGDIFLLCSDGLTGMLADAEIEGMLGLDGGLEYKCRALVEAANSAGGHDNVTVLLIQVVEE
ncbi:MAG: protein phosphatase 2C domain-containing protein [Verrucomicrobiota bacterium]